MSNLFPFLFEEFYQYWMREITLVFFGILAGISYDINVCHLWILKAKDCVGTDFTHCSLFFFRS